MNYPCNFERHGEEHEIFRHTPGRFLVAQVERQLTVFDRETVEMVA